MDLRIEDPSFADVQQVLRQYLKPKALEQLPVQYWPAVREIRNVAPVTAIRRVVDQALRQLETTDASATQLLRDRYVQGLSIGELANHKYNDASTLHRHKNDYIKELGVILGDLNRAAQRRLRAQRFDGHGPVVGVHAYADELAQHLCDPHATPVLVLEGMGGIGKTTLARMVAYRVAQSDAFGGVLWTSAQQVEFDVFGGRRHQRRSAAMRAEDLVGQLAAELGLHHTDRPADLRTNAVSLCKRTPYLIVFDNLESLEDLDALAPLIEDFAVPSRVLITTREDAPDALPAHIPRRYHTLRELDKRTSIGLLRAAADFVGENSMSGANEGDLAQIYSITGGNPLALWLVAGQARNAPWRAFLQEFLEHGPRGGKVEELYEYLYRRSWELLSADAQQVLLAMHRFERGTDYDMLRDVAGMEVAPFRRAVEELRCRMLLLFDGPDTVYIHRLTYTFLRAGVLGWQ